MKEQRMIVNPPYSFHPLSMKRFYFLVEYFAAPNYCSLVRDIPASCFQVSILTDSASIITGAQKRLDDSLQAFRTI